MPALGRGIERLKKQRKVPVVWCHRKADWVPLGRVENRCPNCGAKISKSGFGAHFVGYDEVPLV